FHLERTRNNRPFICYCNSAHRDLHSFPTRRSSDLYPKDGKEVEIEEVYRHTAIAAPYVELIEEFTLSELIDLHFQFKPLLNGFSDRKSTRLNSSHVKISYAVFCLKKNNTM